MTPTPGKPNSSSPSNTTDPSGEQADVTVNVTVANGKVNPSGATVKVKAGQTVLVTAVSDTADEVHIHGYDKELAAHPGQARVGEVHRRHEGHLRDRDPRERQTGRQARRLVTLLLAGLLLPLHGIGGRQDLPVPFGLAVGGAAVAIALSFVILGLAWRNPRYRGDASGKPLPDAITRTVDAGWFRWIVRLARAGRLRSTRWSRCCSAWTG